MLEMSFLTFSDCTVRSVPIDSDSNTAHPTGLLYHEVLGLLHTQLALIQHGTFIRGGLTIGDIFIDGATVFGPAMVRAYSLESEFAIYPRIVIDPLVFDAFRADPLLRNEIHDLAKEGAYLREIVRRDSAGLYFVDYLKGCLTEFDDDDAEFDFLLMHKQRIIAGASEENGAFTAIAAKYLWLATYHNTVIGELRPQWFADNGLSIEEFLIGRDEMPLVYDL